MSDVRSQMSDVNFNCRFLIENLSMFEKSDVYMFGVQNPDGILALIQNSKMILRGLFTSWSTILFKYISVTSGHQGQIHTHTYRQIPICIQITQKKDIYSKISFPQNIRKQRNRGPAKEHGTQPTPSSSVRPRMMMVLL